MPGVWPFFYNYGLKCPKNISMFDYYGAHMASGGRSLYQMTTLFNSLMSVSLNSILETPIHEP